MSDNDSESSCLSALEDASLGATTPAEPNSKKSKQPTASESTTRSYQDYPSHEDDLSGYGERNPTPDCWTSLVVESKDEKEVLLEKDDVAEHKDDVKSPKSKEKLAEQESTDKSPTKKQKKDKPIDKETLGEYTDDVKSPTKLQQADDHVTAKHHDVVESPKSEERLAKKAIAEESPTKNQKKDKPIDKEPLQKTDDIKSPTKVQQEDELIAAKHQDDVESPKSEESIVKVRLAKQGSVDESPTKKQKKAKSDVESPTKVQKDDDPKDQNVAESPKSEETKEESVVKRKLAEHGSDVEASTKKQKDEPTDKETLEKSQDNAELPKKDKLEDESIVKEELAKQHIIDKESPEKEDIQDEPTDRETGEEQKGITVLPKPKEEIKCESIEQEKVEDGKIEQMEIAFPDKNYFEDILKGFYKNDKIRLFKCEGGDQSSIQESFMCEVRKFTLIGYKKINIGEFKLSVVVKQLKSKHHQALYKSDIGAKNEKIAYNTIFPNLKLYGINIPVPMCFFANDEQIIVQDLCALKYESFNKSNTFLTIKECGYTLDALANFHAATFVLKYKNNEKLQEIKNLTMNILYDGEAPVLEHQETSLKGILSIYTSKEQSVQNDIKVEALKYLIKFSKSDIKDLFRKEQDDYVFCHGDLLLTNFLFKLNDAEQKKTEGFKEMNIKFIDFQRVYFCSVASDLVYLLFINLKSEDYIAKKEDLLKRYFHCLKKNIADCGVGDNFKLTYEWLEKEIDRFTEYGIIYALWILPYFFSETPKKDEEKDEKKDEKKEVTEAELKKANANIIFNERMSRWVDYYSTIYEKKFEK